MKNEIIVAIGAGRKMYDAGKTAGHFKRTVVYMFLIKNAQLLKLLGEKFPPC